MAMAQIDEAAVTTEVRVAPADYTKLFGVSSESTLRRLKISTDLRHAELLQGLMISSSGAFRVTSAQIHPISIILAPLKPVNILHLIQESHRIATCHNTPVPRLNHQHLAFLQCCRANTTVDGIAPSHHAAAGGQRSKSTLRGMKLHHVNQLVLKSMVDGCPEGLEVAR